MGRTFDYFKQKKAEELRPDLLNACLHNLVYDRQCEESRSEWLFELINLTYDGITGLLNVAQIFGEKLLKDEELWGEDDCLISEASDRFGAEIVWQALKERSQTNLNVKAYLGAVISHRQNLEDKENSQTTTTRKILELDTVLEQIEKATRHSYPLVRFGKYAEEKEIEQINEKFLTETRREQLIRYL